MVAIALATPNSRRRSTTSMTWSNGIGDQAKDINNSTIPTSPPRARPAYSQHPSFHQRLVLPTRNIERQTDRKANGKGRINGAHHNKKKHREGGRFRIRPRRGSLFSCNVSTGYPFPFVVFLTVSIGQVTAAPTHHQWIWGKGQRGKRRVVMSAQFWTIMAGKGSMNKKHLGIRPSGYGWTRSNHIYNDKSFSRSWKRIHVTSCARRHHASCVLVPYLVTS